MRRETSSCPSRFLSGLFAERGTRKEQRPRNPVERRWYPSSAPRPACSLGGRIQVCERECRARRIRVHRSHEGLSESALSEKSLSPRTNPRVRRHPTPPIVLPAASGARRTYSYVVSTLNRHRVIETSATRAEILTDGLSSVGTNHYLSSLAEVGAPSGPDSKLRLAIAEAALRDAPLETLPDCQAVLRRDGFRPCRLSESATIFGFVCDRDGSGRRLGRRPTRRAMDAPTRPELRPRLDVGGKRLVSRASSPLHTEHLSRRLGAEARVIWLAGALGHPRPAGSGCTAAGAG